jgi:DUF4097 and DUF4098 domain-containing protein YvlB
MRPTFLLLGIVMTTAAPLFAQDAHDPDPRIVIREQVRDVILAAQAVRVREVARAYQGRNAGPEQTERFSRKVKIGRDGRVSLSNIAGDIVVATGGSDELSIEAVKRTRGSQSELQRVSIIVEERGGRVDIRTEHPRYSSDRDGRNGDHVSVDYTLTVPASVAVDVKSVSGNIKVTASRGAVRAESVSGDITATDTPKLELAKSVSGNVTLAGVSTDGDLAAGSISGTVTARAVKVHGLSLSSVSGNLKVTDARTTLSTASVRENLEI